MLAWANKYGTRKTVGYDIDIKYINNITTFFNNSIENPKKYDFVITNPPYLYINYNSNKNVFNNNKHTDLYQIAIESILDSIEGILIIPINFLSSNNSKYIRELFFNKFQITQATLFTHQVFKDTTITVIALYYTRKDVNYDKFSFILKIRNIDSIKEYTITLENKYNWQIGGDFIFNINKSANILNLKRLLIEDMNNNNGNKQIKCAFNHIKNVEEFYINQSYYNYLKKNIIMLKAIDSGSEVGKICLEDIRIYNIDALVSINTSRNQIEILNNLSIDIQENIIKEFNNILTKNREKYYSLFMTNYRDNNRKRISFDFAYKLINYIYINNYKNNLILNKNYNLFEEE